MIGNLPSGWASVHPENPRWTGMMPGQVYGIDLVALDDKDAEIHREYVAFGQDNYPQLRDLAKFLSDVTQKRRRFQTP